ncbi:hypothetical protein AS888_00075 [Peribacillus simplex]|uniref:Lipoprotein n=1 Tax=Peribacillus simplex TaxID=1478 RepID=A0A109MZI2_9BACI|nr:hypothetical protein [Peribacillus simplex]KWW20725.1 hypothetical protein AS888_00075 [Peribacillus simplex]
MKRSSLSIIISLFLISMSITGCINSENTSKKVYSKDLSSPLKEHYVVTSKYSGFSESDSDIYSNRWVSEIYNLFNWEIPEKNKLQGYYNNVNRKSLLTKAMDTEDNTIRDYIKFNSNLGVNYSKDEKDDLVDMLYKYTVKDDYLIRIETKKYLDIPVEGDEYKSFETKIISNLNNTENIMEKIDYYYVLMLLDKEHPLLKRKVIKNLTINIQNRSLTPVDINRLYKEKKLKEQFDIKFTPYFSQKDLQDVITRYTQLNSEMSIQTLYNLLYISKSIINKDELDSLHKFFDGTKLENGWTRPDQILNVYSTYQGLVVAVRKNEFKNINSDKVNTYLEKSLNNIKNKNIYQYNDYLKIKYILQSFILTKNNEGISNVKEIISKSLKTVQNKKITKNNVGEAIVLIELADILDINKSVVTEEFINQTQKNIVSDTSNLLIQYYNLSKLSRYSKFSINSEKLSKFQNKDGTFSEPGLLDSEATRLAIEIYGNIDKTVPKNKQLIDYYMARDKKLKEKNDLSLLGQNYEILNLLQKE